MNLPTVNKPNAKTAAKLKVIAIKLVAILIIAGAVYYYKDALVFAVMHRDAAIAESNRIQEVMSKYQNDRNSVQAETLGKE